MGLFSLFKKKDSQKAPAPTDKDASRAKQREEDKARLSATTESRQNSQREIARATALKIDAIESEMESAIFNSPEPSWRNKRPPKPEEATHIEISDGRNTDHVVFQDTLPLMGASSTEFLIDDDGSALAVLDSAVTPVIEEIAILYASEQIALTDQMLQSAIHDDSLGSASRSAWWMLFDLYQILGKESEFENLSIDYASKYETSPPSWIADLYRSSPIASPASFAGLTPTVAFAGTLDGSIVKQLEKVQSLAEKNQVFRLEFARVANVTPEGCALLLKALKTLGKKEHDLIMVGAAELATKIQSIIKIGRRDETEAPWLLLLEILQLLDREKDFEEASMDYCVTFEVSPPAFEPPQKIKVTTAAAEKVHPDISPDRFMMPPVISGSLEKLMADVRDYAAQYNPVLIDCSRLTRVEFSAAGQLMNGLAPLATGGKVIEFQGVNHLVAALFQVIGLNSIAKIFPHKY
ncbi:MAG: STAS domain-containing protein [Burkholderiales bacterium]|nr:STAS domain-containing protein [Burkholderiales bacterium]